MKHAIIIFTIFLVASSFLPLDIPQAQALAYTCVGCTETTSGGNTIVTFTSSGSFTPSASGTVEYLVIAGGGGGAATDGGGGGAGGFRTGTGFPVTAQAYTITVGAGGAGGTSGGSGSNGGLSTFSSITSIGGGASLTNANGASGGSGGGADNTFTGGAGTVGQGFAGGNGLGNSMGGGGGSSAVGANGVNGVSGGNGGAGTASSITGTSVTRAGGGGGGIAQANTQGSGGTGGGGNASATAPQSGTANTGSGGGGSGNSGSANAGYGGSGIVILSFVGVTAPDAPTALAAAASSSSVIGLTWTAPANNGGASITGYKIERESPTAGGFSVLSANTGTSATSYSSTGLTANTQYNYRVSAINSAGTSAASSASASTTYLAAPTSLTLGSITTTSIDLTWVAPSGTVTGYKIERSLDNSSWTNVSANTGTSAVTYSNTGLTSGTQYYYRVSAINSVGTSAASSTANTFTLNVAPTSLTLGSITTTSIDLTWVAPSGTVTGYKIERSLDNSSWSNVSANTGTSAVTYSNTGLSSGTIYYYRVSAINAGGTSAASSTANTFTLNVAPTSLAATPSSTSVIGLTWTAPSGTVTGYKIERESPTGGGFSVLSANTGTSATNYSSTGLTASTEYNYRVSAINAGGTSAASSAASATTNGVPSQVTGLAVTTTSTSVLGLTWSTPAANGAAITGYKIERSLDNSSWSTVSADTGNTNTSYSNTGLSSGTQYYYRVSAINANGNGSASASANTFTLNNAPTALTATASSVSVIGLTWTAPSGTVTGYKIERSLDNSSFSVLSADTGTSATSYSSTGLTSGTQYYYRVSAINAGGTSAASSTANTFTLNSAPTSLAATASSVSVIGLTWVAPSGTVTGYKIESSLDNSSWTNVSANTGTSATSYSNTGLTSGTHYYYRVSAINAGGTSAASSVDNTYTFNNAPTSLAATTSSSSAIGLTWVAPSGTVTGYKIEYESPTGGGFSTLSANTGNNTASYSSTGLLGGTEYNYKVSAINAGGTSAASSADSDITPAQAPTALTATASSTSVIGLTWTAPSGTVTGYKIERSLDNSIWSTLSANTSSLTTSYSSTGLSSGTQYYYRVSGVSTGGAGDLSTVANTFTLNNAPTSLAATASSVSVIGLTWTAPSGTVTGYKIERSLDNSSWTNVSANTGTSATSYSNTGLSSGTIYYYRVSAINAGGTSAASSVDNTFTFNSAPTALTATASSTSVIGLTWTAPSGTVTGYKIERSLDNSSWSTLSANTGTSVTSYSNTGLTSGTIYYYKVSAINAGGTSAASSVANTFTLNNAPTLFSISGNSTDTSAIDFAWTAPSGTVTGYHLECENPIGTGFVDAVANTGTSATTHQEIGLASNIIYNCKASAINAGGESESSNEYAATTFHVPDGVDDLTASPTNLSTMALTWTTPTSYAPSILGYQINFTSTGGSPLTIFAANTGTTSTSATITGLAISATYGFRVSAITIHGTNATGNIVESATTSNYELGDLTTPDITNEDIATIFFERTDVDATTTNIDVTYLDTYDLSCNVMTKFARTNQTYSNLDQVLVTVDTVKSTLQFTGEQGNDIIDIKCYDEITGTDAKYVLTTTQFPFLDQIANFRNGTYGTFGMIGALDGITLMVIIIGMIGFNRINDFAGVIFTIIAVGALSAFGIIQLWEIIFPVLALIVVVAYGKTRHDQD